MTVEKMREKLSDFCNGRLCKNCVLESEDTCRCGCGTTFMAESVKGSGKYDMTDAEIISAYKRVFVDGQMGCVSIVYPNGRAVFIEGVSKVVIKDDKIDVYDGDEIIASFYKMPGLSVRY